MLVSMFEIGVWAGWELTKYFSGSVWSAVKYGIWGKELNPDELFKQKLLQRISDLEHSNEELTAAVLAHGEETHDNQATGEVVANIKQTITYVSSTPDSVVNDQEDKRPPPAVPPAPLSLPYAPSAPIDIPSRREAKHRIATAL